MWPGDGDGLVETLEDVVLRSILEVVEVVVERGRMGAFEHGVVFSLEPVQGLFGAVRAVTCDGVDLAKERVRAAATRDLGLCDRNCRLRVGDVALEAVHVVLLASAILRVNPEERADTLAVWARWHLLRHSKLRVSRPDACLVDAEHGKVVHRDIAHVALVRDSKRATLDVI